MSTLFQHRLRKDSNEFRTAASESMNMNNPIKATHREIQIEYDERENQWVFELRGRERKAESLAKAKEFIDKPVPQDKKPFTRIQAWYKHYLKGWAVVEITSIAENRYGIAHVWISWNNKREKVRVHDLYQKSPVNDKLVAEWGRLQKEIENCRSAQNKLHFAEIELPEDKEI